MDAKAILDGLLNTSQKAAGTGMDVAKQASAKVAQGGTPAALLSGLGGAGAVALLFGDKGTKKFAKKALAVGGTAAVGGIAYKVFSDWKANSAAPAQVDIGTPINELPSPAANQRSQAIVQAMISAARADGHIDELEQARITGQIKAAGLEQDVTQFLLAEMSKPLDAARIAALADSPEAAGEIYLVSAMFIDKDVESEQRYLENLASAMGLNQQVTAQLDRQLAAA